MRRFIKELFKVLIAYKLYAGYNTIREASELGTMGNMENLGFDEQLKPSGFDRVSIG